MKVKVNELKEMINEAVRKKLREELKESPGLDPVGKTETGKKVGVGQIRDIDNDGDIDSSDEYLAYRRKKITQAMKKEELNEEGYKKSVTWGDIPDPEELYELMDGEAFDMVLKGADSLAWDYAMDLSPDPRAGSTAPGEGLHASLVALVEAPEPDELSDEQYEDVEQTLDRWNERYADQSIAETAWSVASSIMEVLGVEWI